MEATMYDLLNCELQSHSNLQCILELIPHQLVLHLHKAVKITRWKNGRVQWAW